MRVFRLCVLIGLALPACASVDRPPSDVPPRDMPDASSAPDANTPGADAGPALDAGSAPDAGSVADGGARTDAGTIPTTGMRSRTPNGTRHIYSQLQAWTIEGLYYLAVDLDTSEGIVFHAGTFEEVGRMSRIGHRWITGTHSVLMFDDQPSTGAALFAYDADTRLESEIMRLGHPGLRAGRSQEEMDREGRWVAVYIDQATSGGPRIVTADIVQRRVGADVSIQELGCDFEPDWVGVDPTGQYLLVQSVRDGNGRCSGLWAHDISTGAALHQLTDHHNHGTTGLGPTGRPYFLSTELAHPNDNGSPGIFRYWIDTAQREVVGAPLPWGALDHISCLGGPGDPCMASGANDLASTYRGQIWSLAFDGTRTVIEPHNANGCDYWGQSQATAGPNGRYAYATHGGNCNAIHDVVVQ